MLFFPIFMPSSSSSCSDDVDYPVMSSPVDIKLTEVNEGGMFKSKSKREVLINLSSIKAIDDKGSHRKIWMYGDLTCKVSETLDEIQQRKKETIKEYINLMREK